MLRKNKIQQDEILFWREKRRKKAESAILVPKILM
jgi:hypothetical protein